MISGHRAFQGKLSGFLFAGGAATRQTQKSTRPLHNRSIGKRCCRKRNSKRTTATSFRDTSAFRSATHVRFQYFSRRRSQPAAHLRTACSRPNPQKLLERLNRLPRHKFSQTISRLLRLPKWAAQRCTDGRPLIPLKPHFMRLRNASGPSFRKKTGWRRFTTTRRSAASAPVPNNLPTASSWSAKEQSAAQKAAPEVLSALAAANRAYARNSATCSDLRDRKNQRGNSAVLQQRMSNDPETESRIAAEEQSKITRLRLEKLLSS